MSGSPEKTAASGPVSVFRLPRNWYAVCRSRDLKTEPLAWTVLDIPLVVFRDGSGRVAAVLDRCAHRNAPLSMGRIHGGLIECAYHGWRFDAGGRCRAVPGLREGDCNGGTPGTSDIPKNAHRERDVPAFPATERHGFVWVWPVAEDPQPESASPGTEPFPFPFVDQPGYTTVRRSNEVDASLYNALENTLDVPHTAVLHRGLFRGIASRRSIEVVVRPGTDRVEAEFIGEPRPGGVMGRILAPGGGVVEHFDRFILPSIAQVEYRLGASHLLVTTAFTPISDHRTALHSAVTFRLPVPGGLVEAFVAPIANRIFAQDSAILRRQTANIRRFGGEHFTSTDVDVLGRHIVRLLRQAEAGEPSPGPAPEERLTMQV